MFSENEPKSTSTKNGPAFILGVILLAVILLMMGCVLSFMLYNQLKEPSPTSQPDIPAIMIPAELLPTAMPANHFSIHLPMILSGSVSISEQIWKVTKIKSLGYELDGQRYDLATFTRIDGQATAQGHCINPGWGIPELGTEYLLNAKGIFVPLYQPDAHPLQRFLKIR